MRAWIDQLSFRARLATVILVFPIVAFEIAEIDPTELGNVVEKALSASWWWTVRRVADVGAVALTRVFARESPNAIRLSG
jgi:hypothetical protein